MKRTKKLFERFYKIPGIEEPLPSVTTILDVINKPALLHWATGIKKKKKIWFISSLLKNKAESYKYCESHLITNWNKVLDKNGKDYTLSILKKAQSQYLVTRDISASFGTNLHK